MMMDYLFASYHIWRTQNSEGKNLLNVQGFNEFSSALKLIALQYLSIRLWSIRE